MRPEREQPASASIPVKPLAVAFVMPDLTFDRIHGPRFAAELADDDALELLHERPLDARSPVARELLERAELVITGWGTDRLTEDFLHIAPDLRAIVHSGGSVRAVVDQRLFSLGIAVTSGVAANAMPVAEFTIAAIVLSAKRALSMAAEVRAHRGRIDVGTAESDMGMYDITIGIVGASHVGRAVLDRLSRFDVRAIVFDPFLTDDEARRMGAELVTLERLAELSDIVSLHAPLLPETVGMIDRSFLDRMRPGATLINTARGALVDHDALADRLERGDLDAVLDVTEPEILPPDDRLWATPRTLITPHIAGSMGREMIRLTDHAAFEIRTFARTGAFADPIRAESLQVQA